MIGAAMPSSLSFPADNSHPYRYVAMIVVLMGLMVVAYPDRMVGTKSRKNIHTVTPAHPLIGNLTWILNIITQRTRLLDEIYRLQKEQAIGGCPLHLRSLLLVVV